MANVSSSNGLEKRPKLRFPGFDEPYRAVKLGQISSLIKRNDPRSNAPIMMLSAGNGFIMQSDKYSRDNAGQSLKKYTLLKKGELAYNHGASKAKQFGCCYELREEEARIPYVYHCFKVQDTEYTPYVALELNNTKMDKQLKRLVSSSVRMDGLLNISYDEYMSVVVYLPAYAEQKHIADFLEKLDMRIAKQEQLIESLKKYKRGVVQKFFSEKEMAQWETVKLKDVVDIFDGTHQTPNYKSEGVRFISVENILNPLSTEKYISNDDYRKEFKVHPEYGDVLMTRIGDIGRTCYVNFNIDMAYYVSLALFKCSSKIDGRYLAAYISTNDFQKELWERTLHIAFPKKINTGEIGECVIRLPNIARQIAISDQLDLIERVIRLTEKQYELLRAIRDGFMQQLFI